MRRSLLYTRRTAVRPLVALAAGAMTSCAAWVKPESDGLIAGVCTHLWFADKELVDRTLAAARAANFKMIRWDAPWKEVEKQKGRLEVPAGWDYIVNAANALGIGSLLILDYGNKHYDNGDKPTTEDGRRAFARYARVVAQHFAGRVQHFEVWNEWDIYVGNTTPGSIADYVSLLKVTYPEIKAAAPETVVVAGALAKNLREPSTPLTPSPLEQFLAAPVADCMDALSLHLYAHPERSRSTEEHFDSLVLTVFDKISKSTAMANKSVYVTEIGWTTAIDNPVGVPATQQAALLLRARHALAAKGVRAMFVYELKDGNDRASDKEGNFGVLKFDWQPKQAAATFSSK